MFTPDWECVFNLEASGVPVPQLQPQYGSVPAADPKKPAVEPIVVPDVPPDNRAAKLAAAALAAACVWVVLRD